jgi:hypothetical protein
MTLESREQSPRLGASTRTAELDPLSSPGASGKLGGGTRAGELSSAPSSEQAAATQAHGGDAALDLGDPTLLGGAAPGTLVAGILPEDPLDLVQRYLRNGVNALADYLVSRVLQGITSTVSQALQEAYNNVAGFPDALMGALERSMGLRHLTSSEEGASRAVHGPSLINYSAVRVIPASYFTKLSQMRAFVTANVIHYPNDAVHLDTCCHELTHVAQYQAIGLIYIPEAIHAQHTGGYTYGNLATARQQGKTYRDFNREQQAQIAGDFYRVSVQSQAPSSSGSGSLADYTHFITQMRSGGYW